LKERAKLTDGITTVEFDVLLSEDVSRSSVITDKTVESGANVSDHIQTNPLYVSITGIMTKQAFTSYQRLVAFHDSKSLLNYVGRNGVSSVAIETLDTKHPRTNIGGFDFSMVLKLISTTQTQQVEIVPAANNKLGFSNRTAATKNEGTQQQESSDLDSTTEGALVEEVKELSQLDKIDQFLKERGY